MIGPRPRLQVVLAVLPGAEPWLRVEHQTGWFKVPGSAPALEIAEGAAARWHGSHQTRVSGEVWVRVPLSLAKELGR